MLRSLRDRDGRPNGLARALGLLVALLLAFPLTALVLRLLDGLISALY